MTVQRTSEVLIHRRCIVFALAASLLGTAAARSLELIEGAHEAALGGIGLPSGTAGTLIVRTCSGCDPVALRVTADTVYKDGSRTIPLDEFSQRVGEIRDTPDGNGTAVTVFYRLRDNRVTRVIVRSGE